MRRFQRRDIQGRRHQADLFLADLLGESPGRARRRDVHTVVGPEWRPASPARDAAAAPVPALDDEFDEAVPLGGRGGFRHDPLGGVPGDNVAARWNVDAATASDSTIDIVVHLHGYSALDDDAKFLPAKAALAGLDMIDDAGAVVVRAARPTLALVPRGRHTRGPRWVFDRLPDRGAFDALVAAGLSWLCETVLRLPAGSALTRGRVTLAAHSGGGAALSVLLARGVNPDEVICFDSMYGGEDPIRQWAEARIAAPDASRCGLRVFYTGCSAPSATHPSGRWVSGANGRLALQSAGSWAYVGGTWHLVSTEVSARRLHHALERALAGVSGGAALVNRFRVQQTSVPHNDIPKRYSPLLLDDIAADMPARSASAAPPATSRPACVDNDDWLTRPPRKPGGTDPPPRPDTAKDV